MTESSRARDEGSQTTELRRQARDLSLSGKYKKAAHLYQQLLLQSPHDAQAALRLAELRRRIGDPSGARTAYQQAITLYLDAGWNAKALAVETALERLGHVPIVQRVRWSVVVGYLRVWIAKFLHVVRFGRTP